MGSSSQPDCALAKALPCTDAPPWGTWGSPLGVTSGGHLWVTSGCCMQASRQSSTLPLAHTQSCREQPAAWVQARSDRYVVRRHRSRVLQTMEASLRTRSHAHLSELALLNLASMYELSSSMPSAEAKTGLAAWAHRVAPEDFDMACLRLAK